jgi:hypothetical protein
MKSLFLAVFAASALTACAAPQAQSLDGPNVNHRRLCDIPMAWEYKTPQPDVPAKYQQLVGLWTGGVLFAGDDATMCIAVAVQEVKPDGKTDAMFNWNLGGTSSTNKVSQGQANWWAQTVVIFPDKGEQVVFASIKPYNGLWYRYVLNFPTEARPDLITGYLEATKAGSATDVSPSVWVGHTDKFPVELRRTK